MSDSYDRKIRERERKEEELMLERQQVQVNRLADMYECYPLFKKEYNDLCTKLYGRVVKKKWYSLNEIIQDIEDLKVELEKRS